MNLLVGINGVGKTTVLDSIRICLSKVIPSISCSKSRPLAFVADDIRINASALTVQLSFTLNNKAWEFLVHKQRNRSVSQKESGIVREQTIATPDKETLTEGPPVPRRSAKVERSQPFGLFFSTRRSLLSDLSPSVTKISGGQTAAFADALVSRELRISEFADWMRAQEALGKENPRSKKHLGSLRRAALSFLPECRNLRPEGTIKPQLIVDKGRLTLNVRQLSDGERGSLSLVLDIARRLSQANPDLPDPVKQGEGIVLIDELDLHLHPKWQRTIVERLTRTFPRCQFIVTTHSPQIVAAVEPEQVLLISDAGVFKPKQTFGMDSNWILRHLMETEDRPASAAKAIREVEELINKCALQ
jgi:hypothetical protein